VVKIHTVVTCVLTLQSGKLVSVFKNNIHSHLQEWRLQHGVTTQRTTLQCPSEMWVSTTVTLHTGVHKSEDGNINNIHRERTTRN